MAELMTYAEQCEHTAREAADQLEAAARVLAEGYDPGGARYLAFLATSLRGTSAPTLIRVAEAIVGRRG